MKSDVLSSERFDVYRAVTNTIVAAIEAGAGEFVMPWHGNGVAIAKPQNAHTHMEYHGINVIALWAQAYEQGYRSGYWGTYRQWQEVGAQVAKGERGSTIVFFKRIEEESKAQGDEPSIRLFARASRVFNADQVEGWTPPEERRQPGTGEIMESVALFVQASKADVHIGTMARYNIPGDYIEMPEIGRFIDTPTSSATQAYGATVLHELVHWAGAKHRLDRFGERLKMEDVAAEELVAEIGAAFLCADLGVSNTPRPDHAAYVGHWLQLLKNDTRAIFTASRLANQAATYLHEIVAAGEW
ncbi:ArdC family protein [Sphingomonas sp. SUN039]|uniref:ArdC family protein n=1 Tax=Sphingomonas sp. SUN039 TaxID=2937787 RepID=UPI0021645267|nr:zincin-like metallopeptidase domain-containing protein [Sphingomonas sp. SUN039]UVO53062.1 zincin-like metallopeptidase domain-containing protein [Sphingomonas sp. SUN039]